MILRYAWDFTREQNLNAQLDALEQAGARIPERTREGLEAARKRGRVGERPLALSPSQKEKARRMRDEERQPLYEVATLFKISGTTVQRA